MQNNQLGTIAVSNTKRPRAFFNKSADLHTTMDFGSVIPAKVQRVIPNSKVVMQSSERLLLAPLVRPTMGRLSLKGYHNFVPMSDIWPNFAAMMAQEPIYRNGSSFVPTILPNVPINQLSLSVLFGARLSVYIWSGTGSTSYADLLDISSAGSGFDPDDPSTWSGAPQAVTAINDLMIDKTYSGYGLSNVLRIPCHLLIGSNTSTTYSWLPLSNSSLADLFNIDGNSDVVTVDGADVVLPLQIGTYYYLLCFRLSSFGKRLRKVLIGCGYELNFSMSDRVSILPLLAFYKSYFDVFGLTLYNNWESTDCSRLISSFMNFSTQSLLNLNLFVVVSGSGSVSGSTQSFIFRELSMCLYTDEQDFVSSHTTTTAVSPSASGFIGSINTDVDYTGANQARVSDGSVQNPQSSLPGNPNGHAFINNIIHGQMDSELLKRLYRWTNRNTVAGRRIAELLRAQGLGSYVDECKSNFIGSFELPIEIFDVPSQSDTFSDAGGTAEGMRLGEYGARGIAQNQERPFDFETNEDGYWVTLFTVVPKGGYSEAFDPTVFALDKWSQYNPEFDSLGYEASRKALVQGSQPFASDPTETSKLSDSFGYSPRYFAWKFGRNVINGDFSRRGSRSAYAPFMLEKLIDVGEREVLSVDHQSGVTRTIMSELFKPSSLPIAGDVWRYPTRYPWIGQFNRIFYMAGDTYPLTTELSQFVSQFEFFSNQEDNFILHTIFNVKEFAPMLPVEDSFETYDDDNGVNGSMGKA